MIRAASPVRHFKTNNPRKNPSELYTQQKELTTTHTMIATQSLRCSDLRQCFLRSLEAQAPAILASWNPGGRFGTEPWVVRDQDVLLPLALLYKTEGTKFHRDRNLLQKIAEGGNFLRERQDKKGMYPFDKKDGSNWGDVYMPWTYLRWIIAYDLLKDDLAPADRHRWEEGLQLGYAGIAATELSSASNIYPGPLPGQPGPKEGEVIPWIHNIPSHHAAGLYLAGKHFQRRDWMDQAHDFMGLVVAAQTEHGWWTEHSGPVVIYNRVYLESLAIYHHFSKDPVVGEALVLGNRFHLHYTYPDGTPIETIDERNYTYPVQFKKGEDDTLHHLPRLANLHPGFYASPEGHAMLGHLIGQYRSREEPIEGADYLLLCLPDKEMLGDKPVEPEPRFFMENKALVARESPWVVSLSAYCCKRTPNRFIQDRQNLLSLFHKKTGLILGGGNTKIQPLWSTMTVGCTRLVSPEGSTRDSDLTPETRLSYVPDHAEIEETSELSWKLTVKTAGAVMEIETVLENDSTARLCFRLATPSPTGATVTAHLPFIRYPESPVVFSDGSERALESKSWALTGVTALSHQNWKLTLPDCATVQWPALPHNPYSGDGHADIEEGRMVVSLPFGEHRDSFELHLSVE